MAIAHVRADWQTKQLATAAIAEKAIETLLTRNVVPQFHQLILDMLNKKEELERYTQAQLKKMVNKELPQNSINLINTTLEYVAKQALKQQQQAQTRIQQRRLQSTPTVIRQIQLLQSQAVTLLELKELVTDASSIYTTKSILQQLTKTFERGWTSNTLKSSWKEVMQLRHKPITTTTKTTSSPKKTPNKSTTRKPTPKKATVKITAPTLKKEKNTIPMNQREQTARPLGSHNGKITGTDIEFVSGLCNNWQVWNSCALLTSPRGCPWKHVCSKCGSALHGAGSCPYK